MEGQPPLPEGVADQLRGAFDAAFLQLVAPSRVSAETVAGAALDALRNETMAADGDVVLVPRVHHPYGAPYGFDMYYLNVMADPLPNWRFVPTPEVE